jgi:hypothetical protein
MARTYKRDGNGRFAGGGGSSGGGGGKRPAVKSVSRGVNRLTRDNAGKITSVGGEGATARGGRLKTAAGNKRAMQTAKVSGGRPAGTMKGKIKRDPGAASKVGQQAKPAARSNIGSVGAKLAARDKATGRGDRAESNIKGRFSGQAGKRMDASIDRAVKQVKTANLARLMKPKEQVKAERAANAEAKRQAAAAKPKRVRSVESQRMSRAKQVEKRRSMNISNPAGERQDSAGRMAANAARTQQRATAFLKAKAKPPATPKPANAVPKSTARPLSQRETQNLVLAKSNLAISKERLAFAREAKSTAKGPLEKLKATDRINEQQSNIRQINNKITAINARPAPGRPITGADRSGNRKQLSAFKKSGAIKGSIKRNASASSNLKNKSALNAGKYKNIYMANANKAAAAKRKRKP